MKFSFPCVHIWTNIIIPCYNYMRVLSLIFDRLDRSFLIFFLANELFKFRTWSSDRWLRSSLRRHWFDSLMFPNCLLFSQAVFGSYLRQFSMILGSGWKLGRGMMADPRVRFQWLGTSRAARILEFFSRSVSFSHYLGQSWRKYREFSLDKTGSYR